MKNFAPLSTNTTCCHPELDSGSQRKKSAFTLIELLVVIVIIGILATIGVAQFNKYQEKARDVRRKSTLQQINKVILLDRLGSPPESTIIRNGVSIYTGYGLYGLESGSCSDPLRENACLHKVLNRAGFRAPAETNSCYVYGFNNAESFQANSALEGESELHHFFVAIPSAANPNDIFIMGTAKGVLYAESIKLDIINEYNRQVNGDKLCETEERFFEVQDKAVDRLTPIRYESS